MTTIQLLTLLILVLSPATAFGQAYCSLREPVRAMQTSFPDFAHYRSIVRVVDETDRANILETLPFTIHENELGTHTLYMVFADNDELLGIVHVRTERSRWGLTEIAWTFNSDFEIVGMHFQRSRDRYRKYIESEAFQKEIRGKNFDELRTLLTENGEAVNKDVLVIPREGHELALNVIRSALKTISATQLVWHDSLPVVNR
ncbi:MAG TPA: hypothetical protein EYG46_01675 [Myxococcales bacterium]|nr:hypothetical protein [Myxococcales bacterium]